MFETGTGVSHVFQCQRIEHPDYGHRLRELIQSLIKLAFQRADSVFPLALYQDRIASAQLDENIGYALSPATFGTGLYPMITEHFHKQGVDRLFADGFRVIQQCCHVGMGSDIEDTEL